jgi:hypothetical protein
VLRKPRAVLQFCRILTMPHVTEWVTRPLAATGIEINFDGQPWA